MRIAISGTHGSGKTTLIEAFLGSHPDFVHEPEPYVTLTEDYGEEFSAEPSIEDLYRQLEFNLERLRHYSAADPVIFERSPIDFLAYMLVIHDSHQRDASLLATARTLIVEGTQCLDLIVFLPLMGSDLPATEYPKLRREVDQRLAEIFDDDEFAVPVVEASGSVSQRLRLLENVLRTA